MKNGKILIINHTTGYPGKIKAVIHTLEKEGNTPCLIAFNSTERELEAEKLNYKTPSDYMSKEDYAQLEEEAIAFVKALGSGKFDDNLSLVKLLQYETISLWWVNEGAFWRQVVRDLLRYVGSLVRIIAEENPAKIIIVDDGSLLAKATIATGQAQGIPVQSLSPGLALRLRIVLRPLWTELKLRTILRLGMVRDIVRKIVARFWGSASPKERSGNKILLNVTIGRTQVVVDPKSGNKWKESLYLGPVIRELRENSTNDILFLYTFTNPFSIIVPGEVKSNGVTTRPWEYYLTWKILRTLSKQNKRLKNVWKQLESSPSFKELLLYKDIPLWDTLKDELRLRFYTYFPSFIKNIETSKTIIEKENVKAVAIADESSFCNKSLLVAAYPKKIPTLVVQTGVMGANNLFLEYGSTVAELEGSPSKHPLFPSKFSVYGDGSRDILKEAGYPFYDSITVTGQPRYDILTRASETFDAEEFRRKLNIPPDKKLVLIASQPSSTFGNSEVFLRNVLQALKADPRIRIVIKPKPHPSDAAEKWHRQLAEKMGVEVIVLPRNSDTNEALYACDVLITFFSTVALEAIILDKPVVTVNLTDQPDPIPYAQSGVALGVYKAEDIAPAVKKALNDRKTRTRLKQGREKYLYQQFYKLDGQATKRVVDLIYQMSQPVELAKVSPGVEGSLE